MELLEKQKSSIISDIDLIKTHIEDLNKLLEQYSGYESEYKLKNLEFNDLIIKERTIMIKKAESNKEIQFLEKQITDIQNEIIKIEETSKRLNHLKEMEFWLNNKFLELVLFTEKNVMLKLKDDFSKLFSDWFSVLVGETLTTRLLESF